MRKFTVDPVPNPNIFLGFINSIDLAAAICLLEIIFFSVFFLKITSNCKKYLGVD